MAGTFPGVFYPPRQRGLIYHGLASLFLIGGIIGCLLYALQLRVGAGFILLLLLSLILFAPLPLVIYRAYSLFNATYTLERDGLRIRWGLRAEDIPLPEIEWVRPVSDLGFKLALPRLIWPGAVLGTRTIPELGLVEFMAADIDNLLLIATPQKVYAISPDDGRGFIVAFQRIMELGSLAPLPATSIQPAAFARRVWDDRPARILLLVGLVLTIVLWLLTGSLIPARAGVTLGYNASGSPLPVLPAEQLLLLPVLDTFSLVANLGVGVYFYRRDNLRPVAFLLWAASAMIPILFIVAVFFSL